jgi:hypothetical protein
MGLGKIVGLAEPREEAAEARKIIATGRNPIEAKREPGRILAATFGQMADAFLDPKSSEWRNEKHRQQWRNRLARGARKGTFRAAKRTRLGGAGIWTSFLRSARSSRAAIMRPLPSMLDLFLFRSTDPVILVFDINS